MVSGGMRKKIFKMFKIKSFPKISYFLLVFFFWPIHYWVVIFTGIIQTGLGLSVR